jgi:Helix-turn-helix domain
MDSQERRILAHLKVGHSLTSLIALRLFDCSRLAARIHHLRRKHRIKSEIMRVPSGKRIAVYWI